jgi:copper resistance protein B
MIAKRTIQAILAAAVLTLTMPFPAGAGQQPTEPGWPQPVHSNLPFSRVMLNQNELRAGNGNTTYRWEGDAWYGDNLNRGVFRTEGNWSVNTEKFEEAEAQALYSRAITRYFDLQAGLRYDFEPSPSRGWLTFGIEGLAPMYWDIGAFVFISDEGDAAVRVEGYNDLYLTQRLILQPQFEVNMYSKDDASRGIGYGLSDLDIGLRMRYEIRREFAPYIGITYERKYGRTSDFARRDGDSVQDLRLAGGIRVWF